MTPLALVVGVIVCVVLSLAGLGLAIRFARRGGDDAPEEQQSEGAQARTEGGGLRALGAILRPGDEEELDLLKSRTTRAGLYGQDAVDLFLTARLIVLAAGFGLILLAINWADSPLVAIFLAMAIGGLAVILPGIWLDRRTERRQAAVARELPEALDLLVVCLDAGMGLEAALERVAFADGVDTEADLLRQELRQVLGDVRVGVPLEVAFRRFAARIGSEEATTLAAVISKATALGAQIGELLRAHSKKLRQHQLLRLEEIAGKASAKLSLPLTICLLPAGMLLLLGPAFYEVFSLL